MVIKQKAAAEVQLLFARSIYMTTSNNAYLKLEVFIKVVHSYDICGFVK